MDIKSICICARMYLLLLLLEMFILYTFAKLIHIYTHNRATLTYTTKKQKKKVTNNDENKIINERMKHLYLNVYSIIGTANHGCSLQWVLFF